MRTPVASLWNGATIAASAFRQRFITLNLNEDAEPVAVVMELTGLFSRGSELVQ